ncbi:MAG: stage II sporulation protein R [Ruminococcaceae bacterium]|nr:stage II sporulation protein R [Oscillospiraceae bacterium]
MFYKRILTLSVIAAMLLLVIGLLPVHGEDEIYNKVVRLHVLANSDSEEDQAVKIAVRDAILDVTVPLLQDCKTKEEAVTLLEANRPFLTEAAQAVLQKEGFDDAVSIEMGLEDYPTRTYDSLCFPAGEYISMRVNIGEAEGQNWWCCLFPPLCLGAATVNEKKAEDACISVGFTPTQYKIITESDKPVYRARFKILELFGK